MSQLPPHRLRTLRIFTILSLLIVTGLGIGSKYYSGWAEQWVYDYAGDILYEIFWCLLIFLLIPSWKTVSQAPLWVFGITCGLEVLQLWQVPFLEPIRASFVGKWLLGTTFVWWDFLYYALGSFIGWSWLQQLWQLRYWR